MARVVAQSYWLESIAHQGIAPYNAQGSAYQVFRNVKDFGAKGAHISLCFDCTVLIASR